MGKGRKNDQSAKSVIWKIESGNLWERTSLVESTISKTIALCKSLVCGSGIVVVEPCHFCRPGSQPRTLNGNCTVKFVWLFSHLCPSSFRLSCSSVLLGTVSWSLSTHFLAAPNNFSAHAQCWPTRWSVQQKKRKPLLQSRTQSPRGEWWDDPTNPCALTSSSPSRSLEEATFTPNSEF